MSHRAVDRSCGARARGSCELLAARALGLAAAPHTQLAEPTARLSLRRRGSGRLHDDGRGDRLHLALRDRVRRTRAPAHHRHVGEANGRGISRRHEQWRPAVPCRRPGERRLQCPERAGSSSGRAGVHPVRHDVRLPQSGCAAGRRRAGRWRVGHRCAARRRNPPLRPARDAFSRRARPAAENVSRARRALVDGRVRRVEPALRRDRRSGACPETPVAAARRHARAHDAPPQRPQCDWRRARGPPRRRA